eukprot:1218918-Amphidinium_carterae.1
MSATVQNIRTPSIVMLLAFKLERCTCVSAPSVSIERITLQDSSDLPAAANKPKKLAPMAAQRLARPSRWHRGHSGLSTEV